MGGVSQSRYSTKIFGMYSTELAYEVFKSSNAVKVVAVIRSPRRSGQALFGFQLAIVLTLSLRAASGLLENYPCGQYFLVALAVVLLMAPAAYHRIVY
jgi:hypothetical protein